MSDYFYVDLARKLGHLAVEKNHTKSFSVAIISALIDAQAHMEDDWGMVYKVVAEVINDKSLHRDMKQEAVDIIMEYIDLYKED